MACDDRSRRRASTACRFELFRTDKAIIAVLTLAVFVLLLNQFVLHRFVPIADADAAERSIVVLPFANTSGDACNEYFSDGLSEELIGVLGRCSD